MGPSCHSIPDKGRLHTQYRVFSLTVPEEQH